MNLHEVLLWKVKPEPWWDSEPGLMALYPLCHHGEEAEAAIRHAATAIEQNASDVLERRDFLTFLSIYANLKYPLEDVVNIISDEIMRELPLIKMYTEKGREEGSLESLRTSILKALRLRLKVAQTDEFASALELLKDSDRLEHLMDLALTCATIDEFRAALS